MDSSEVMAGARRHLFQIAALSPGSFELHRTTVDGAADLHPGHTPLQPYDDLPFLFFFFFIVVVEGMWGNCMPALPSFQLDF